MSPSKLPGLSRFQPDVAWLTLRNAGHLAGPRRELCCLGCVAALLVSLTLTLTLIWPAPAHAQASSKRLALLLGNSTYAGWPALESCRAAVAGLSGALRRAGYEVSERVNPSNGQMGAAISEFSEALAKSPDAVAVAYFCGYAVALDSRVFLLPATANLSRDTDALSQGIVGRLFINAVARSPARSGLILLDVMAPPGSGAALPMAGLVDAATLGGKAYVTVQTLGSVPTGTTELAAAVAAGVAGGGGDWRALVKSLRVKLPSSAQRSVVLLDPLEGSAAAPTPAPASPSYTAKTPAPGERARATAEPAALGTADVRRAQLALQRLGYYAGKVDGVVGANTVAAIRRFQHELRAEMTGQLSQAQAERLLKESQ